MAYSDGLELIGAYEQPTSTGEAITSQTVECNGDDVAQIYWTYRSPFGLQIEAFGVVITEVDTAPTIAPVIQLNVLAATGAASTTILSMTIDAPLYAKGDGKKASVTALADGELVSGFCMLYTGTALPYQIAPGETLQAELTTAGTGTANVAFQMVALVRVAGFDLTKATVATLLAAA